MIFASKSAASIILDSPTKVSSSANLGAQQQSNISLLKALSLRDSQSQSQGRFKAGANIDSLNISS